MSLQHAVELAAWLIATGRHPPMRAHLIAAGKYGVDVREVARLVGAQGGRAAARRRRRKETPAKPVPHEPGPPQPMRAAVVAIGPTDPVRPIPGMKVVRCRFLSGRHKGRLVDLTASETWLPASIGGGSEMVLLVVSRIAENGEPWMEVRRCMGVASGDGSAKSAVPIEGGR